MKEKPTHILNASSNLLGFCFFVLVSLKAFPISDIHFADDIVAVSILLLTLSVFLSFLSIRSSGRKSERYEFIADYLFLFAVLSIMAIAGVLLFAVV